jgi:hypothetical protein
VLEARRLEARQDANLLLRPARSTFKYLIEIDTPVDETVAFVHGSMENIARLAKGEWKRIN